MLLDRWSATRNVEAERKQLAQKQFEFYADELRLANPYSPDNDAAAIGNARHYLSQFAGFERVYQAMLADAAKPARRSISTSASPARPKRSSTPTRSPAPFTKPGWDFMKAALKDPRQIFRRRSLGAGPQSAPNIDRQQAGAATAPASTTPIM